MGGSLGSAVRLLGFKQTPAVSLPVWGVLGQSLLSCAPVISNVAAKLGPRRVLVPTGRDNLCRCLAPTGWSVRVGLQDSVREAGQQGGPVFLSESRPGVWAFGGPGPGSQALGSGVYVNQFLSQP